MEDTNKCTDATKVSGDKLDLIDRLFKFITHSILSQENDFRLKGCVIETKKIHREEMYKK